ncbi:MAG: xanthine dehydrogenase family protein molybdopterin-binding subunit [Hyphomicrobiaceae bacterium]
MGTNADYQGRIEDDRFVTGSGRFVADLSLPNLAHAAIVRAQVAHARLNSLDTTQASAMPGVLAVYTSADLAEAGIGDQPCNIKHCRPDGQEAFQAGRRVLARDRIRHLGEAVAIVIAESKAAAVAAAENVNVDAEELPVVTDARKAVLTDAPLVWDEVPDNIAFAWQKGDEDAVDVALANSIHAAEFDAHVSRVMAQTMEPRGVAAYEDSNGRLIVYSSTQNPFPMRAGLAAMFDLSPSQIHVKAGDVGGSFGMKSGVYPEDVLVCFAARKLARPVRWIADRFEGFLSDEHGRDVWMSVQLGLDAEYRFTALKAMCDVNIGAYLSGRSLSLIGNFGGIAGVYRIGRIFGSIRGVHSHTQVTAPYRGAGRPEASFAIERVIDIAARELGIDCYELRRRNLVRPEAMPYDTGFTFEYDCGEFEENMIEAARLVDRNSFESRRAEAKKRGKLRGLGMSNPIEVAGGPFVNPGKDYSKLHVGAGGTVTLYSGIMSVGQGTETTLSNVVAERLGIPVASVVYRQGDTDELVGGRGNGGSSAMPVGASSVATALDNLVSAAKTLAAEMLQTSVENTEFADGRFVVRGGTASVTLTDVAEFAAERTKEGLVAHGMFDPPGVTYPNGCHMCEVEVDPATGALAIVKYCVCEDIGTVMNPTLSAGQMHGGIAQGAGQALLEATVHDSESGQLLTGSFMDYAMPRADDFPSFTFKTREVPTAVNPIGAKGIGEAGTVGSLAATINAVCDALAPLGITHIDMPATSERIWRAIRSADTSRARAWRAQAD